MKRAVQKRTLETRAKLLAAAEQVVAKSGYEAVRVEEIVLRAGVAKGTFFAHFRDKDALMDQLIGARIDQILDDLAAQDAPCDVQDLITGLRPLHNFMVCERYVFDVILRYSGAAAIEEIGAIAMTFGRYLGVTQAWLAHGAFRRDISVDLLAEGLQAFAVQAMALHFCALHDSEDMDTRLARYLNAWLLPGSDGNSTG